MKHEYPLTYAAARIIGLQAETAREGIYIGFAAGLFFVIPAHAIAAMFGA